VVIPTYNRRERLRRCLTALFACRTEGLAVDVRVVDDGSTDGTEQLIAELSEGAPPTFRLFYHRQERLGPAEARNLGVRAADTDLVLFTDDDCLPEREWLRSLAQSDWAERAGSVSGKIVSPEGGNWVARYCRHVHYNEFPRRDRPPRVVPFANTANCAYLRSAFLELGGFEPLFSRVGYEDVDLSRRLMLLGYRLTYQPEAVVEHHHRESPRSLYRAYWKRGYASTLLQLLWHSPLRVSWSRVAGEVWHLSGAPLRMLFLPLDARDYVEQGVPLDEAIRFAWLYWLCRVGRSCGSVTMCLRLLAGRQSRERQCPMPAYSGRLPRALREARQAYAALQPGEHAGPSRRRRRRLSLSQDPEPN